MTDGVSGERKQGPGNSGIIRKATTIYLSIPKCLFNCSADIEHIPLGMRDIIIPTVSVTWEVHPRGIPAVQGVGL